MNKEGLMDKAIKDEEAQIDTCYYCNDSQFCSIPVCLICYSRKITRDQNEINFKYVLDVIELLHDKLELPVIGDWQSRVKQIKEWANGLTWS